MGVAHAGLGRHGDVLAQRDGRDVVDLDRPQAAAVSRGVDQVVVVVEEERVDHRHAVERVLEREPLRAAVDGGDDPRLLGADQDALPVVRVEGDAPGPAPTGALPPELAVVRDQVRQFGIDHPGGPAGERVLHLPGGEVGRDQPVRVGRVHTEDQRGLPCPDGALVEPDPLQGLLP